MASWSSTGKGRDSDKLTAFSKLNLSEPKPGRKTHKLNTPASTKLEKRL